jgi:MoxR-like ATPase
MNLPGPRSCKETVVMNKREGFHLYTGGREVASPTDVKAWLAEPPPWRKLADAKMVERSTAPAFNEAEQRRGETYACSGAEEILRVNIALALRRPLLVSGRPGIGKSTLAYHLAWTLGLGPPLRWEVNSQTTLKDGLYSYDAVDHLQATQTRDGTKGKATLDEFIKLGPLGTSLLPTKLPRVLLIDELDKATFDLPNDLLHVFEEGAFTIPELIRHDKDGRVYPFDARGSDDRVAIPNGRVQALHHPVVVITDNGERVFPDAFRRRCVPLSLKTPDDAVLLAIVGNLLGPKELSLAAAAIERYRGQATDVLLQALFLEQTGLDANDIFQVLQR